MFFVKQFKRKQTFKHYLLMFMFATLFLITLLTICFSLENHIESMTEILTNRSLMLEDEIDFEIVREKLARVNHVDSIEIQTIFDEEKIIVVVDKSKNVDKLIKDAEKEGFHIFLYDMTVKEKAQNFVKAKEIISVMILVTISITVVILLALLSLFLKEGYYDVAIMKTIGYKNHILIKIFLIQVSYLFSFSFLIGIFISLVINLIFYPFIYQKLCSFPMLVYIFLKSSLISILIMGLIVLFDVMANYIKIRKIVPTVLFKE